MLKSLPIIAVLFTANAKTVQRRLAANAPNDAIFCAGRANLFKNAASSLNTLSQQSSSTKAEYFEALKGLCAFADVADLGCNDAAEWFAGGPLGLDGIVQKFGDFVKVEQSCNDVWDAYSTAADDDDNNLGYGTDLSHIKDSLKAALNALGNDNTDNAITNLNAAQQEAAIMVAHYASLSLLQGVDIMKIIGSTFREAKSDLVRLKPVMEKDYTVTNWYWHAKPLYDLIYGFLKLLFLIFCNDKL